LSVSTVTPYAFAQPKPTPAAAGKKPAGPAPAGKKPAAPTPAAQGGAKKPAAPAAGATQGGAKKPAVKMTEAQKKTAASKHYREGVKRLEANDHAGALTEFQAANELIPSPAANYKIGLCEEKLGHIAEAIAAYEKFLADAPADKMAEQIADGRKRLDSLKTTPVAVMAVSEPAGATIWIDGTPNEAVSPTELKLVPGKHKIRMAAPGFDSTEIEVEVKAGEKVPDLKVALASAPLPPPAPAPVASAPPPRPATPPPAPPPVVHPKKNNLPAYITLGVAGAGAVVGTIFGVKALSNKSDFDDKPTTKSADDTERNALIADMAFGVALTLGVTGTVLLLSGNKTTEATPKSADASHSNMRLSPYVGPSGGGASAVFSF